MNHLDIAEMLSKTHPPPLRKKCGCCGQRDCIFSTTNAARTATATADRVPQPAPPAQPVPPPPVPEQWPTVVRVITPRFGAIGVGGSCVAVPT